MGVMGPFQNTDVIVHFVVGTFTSDKFIKLQKQKNHALNP